MAHTFVLVHGAWHGPWCWEKTERALRDLGIRTHTVSLPSCGTDPAALGDLGADLLVAAAKHPTFPMLLETTRECLRDVFDVPALREVMSDLRSRTTKLVAVDTEHASPFAQSLLFRWVAIYMYEGDAPLWAQFADALRTSQPFEFDLPVHPPGVAYLLSWWPNHESPGFFLNVKVIWCLLGALSCALSIVAARPHFGLRVAALASRHSPFNR